MKKITKNKIDNSFCGAAGVHHIASELSRRGLIALPTVKNTPGIDILVSTLDGKHHAALQVKTSLTKVSFWPVGYNYESLNGKNNFYVFLRFIEKNNQYEIFLDSSDNVATSINERSKIKKDKNGKFPPCWYLPKNSKNVDNLKNQWYNFLPIS